MHIPAYPRWTCHVPFRWLGMWALWVPEMQGLEFALKAVRKWSTRQDSKMMFYWFCCVTLHCPTPCRSLRCILSPVQDWSIFMCLRRYLERNAKVRWMLTPMSAAFNPKTKTSVILGGRPYHPLSGRFLDFSSQNFYSCIKAMADGTNKACGYWR